MTGQIVWFNIGKGYGFIAYDAGGFVPPALNWTAA